MAVRELLVMGNPLLYQKAATVDLNDSELPQNIQDMKDSMAHYHGVGIAAPQIGISKRIMYFGFESNPRYPDQEAVPFSLLINPAYEILDSSPYTGWEGCLSVPGYRGKVSRPKKIKYFWEDLDGNRHERIAEDFHAKIFQHEYDHLEGILYPMRMSDLKDFVHEGILLTDVLDKQNIIEE